MISHPGKTKGMVTVPRRKHLREPLLLKLSLGTNIAEKVHEQRVLGVTLDEELKKKKKGSPIKIDYVYKLLARYYFCLASLNTM